MPQSRHCRPTTSCIVIVRYIHAPGLRLCYRIHVKLILFILEKGRSHAWASSSSSLVSSEEWRPHTGDDRLLVHNMVWSTMRKVIRTQLTVNDNQRHCDNNTELTFNFNYINLCTFQSTRNWQTQLTCQRALSQIKVLATWDIWVILYLYYLKKQNLYILNSSKHKTNWKKMPRSLF